MSFVLDNSVAMLWLLPQSNSSSGELALARQFGLSAYDAAYLELALREGLPLSTLDARLQAATQAAGVPLLA